VVRESLMILSVLALAATGSTVRGPSGQSGQVAVGSAPEAFAQNLDASANVTIANRRTVGLKKLDLAPAGSTAFRQIVENLGPGRTTLVALPSAGACSFDIHGVYDDGATTNAQGLDLCKNGTINLFE
jgi:hypothetical protein